MARQRLLERAAAPRLWAVVDEAALRRPVGGPKVMHAQIEWLLEASRLPSVTVQILPFNAGAHPAMVGGFSILRFAGRELPDVVYLEHLNNAVDLTSATTSISTCTSWTRFAPAASSATGPSSSSARCCGRTDEAAGARRRGRGQAAVWSAAGRGARGRR